MICAKFRWNWHRGSREEDFFFNLNFKILSMYFHYFVIVSPWKMVWSFIWKKLNSLHKDALYEVWLKCPSCSWEKDSKFRQCIFAILKYLPLEKGVALHLNKLEFPTPKGAFSKFRLNWPNGSWEEDEMWEVYKRTTGDQKGSLEISAQVS